MIVERSKNLWILKIKPKCSVRVRQKYTETKSTCADSTYVIEELVDSLAGQVLQFIKSLEGQQAPVKKPQGLETQTDINLRGGLAQLAYNDTVSLFHTLLLRMLNHTESLIILRRNTFLFFPPWNSFTLFRLRLWPGPESLYLWPVLCSQPGPALPSQQPEEVGLWPGANAAGRAEHSPKKKVTVLHKPIICQNVSRTVQDIWH